MRFSDAKLKGLIVEVNKRKTVKQNLSDEECRNDYQKKNREGEQHNKLKLNPHLLAVPW